MFDEKWIKLEEDARKKFDSQQCPFPTYQVWCDSKTSQIEKGFYRYTLEKEKAELEWNKNYNERLEEFEKQVGALRKAYEAKTRYIKHIDEENARLQAELQKAKALAQQYKEIYDKITKT